MQIVRFRGADGGIALGAFRNDRVISRFRPPAASLPELLRLPLDEFRTIVERTVAISGPPERDTVLLAPVDGLTEVWAAGVTYQRSEEARMEESGTPDVYSKVYTAERPEIFMKATARRVVGPEGTVVVRRLDLGRPGAGARDRRQRPRRDRRLHDRQRRELAEHRG